MMNKILLTFANAKEDLKLGREAIEIAKTPNLNKIANVISSYETSFKDIQNRFLENPDISVLHFGGHASNNRLALERYGSIESTYKDGFTDFLSQQDHLQLVFLNGCETEEFAEAIIRKNKIPYVIATSMAIKDEVAIEFAINFYTALADNKSIINAYNYAKSTTTSSLENNDESCGQNRLTFKEKRIQDKGFPWQLFQQENATSWHIKSPPKQLTAYYEEIKEFYQINALNEKKAKLSDLYILPDFKIHRRCYDIEVDFDKEGFQDTETNIHDFVLDTFLQKNTNNYNDCQAENARLMVLLGQPGQGKSSFCARVIHDFLKDNRYRFDKKLYFLRLRDLSRPKDFMARPIETLKAEFKKKKIDLHLNNALLILDGLDELSMSAGLTNANIKELINDIHRMIEKEFTNLYCILTSRYNYFKIKDINAQKTWIVKLNELTEQQQLGWLEQYKGFNSNTKLSETKIQEINNQDNENFKHIRELINQPILLHLVAQLDFEIDSKDNRAAIYKKLFDTLGKQSWNPDAKDRYQENFEEELRAYISTLAYQIYISDFEYIKRKEIEDLPETIEFKDNCLQTTTSLDEALKEVLVSFYFKNSQKEKDDDFEEDKNDYALEFMHKSLQEYVTAEYIWTAISENFLSTTKKGRKTIYTIDSWNEALKTIWELCHHQRLTTEIHDYLIEIIQNNTDAKKELADRMSLFLEDLLRHQFIYQYDASNDKSTTHSPIEKGITCFYTYWQVLAQLQMKEVDNKVENQNYINDDIKEGFATLLKLAGSYGYYGINLSGQNLAKVNLSNCLGRKADLRSADLRHADLRSADFGEADFSEADLRFANFTEVDLRFVDLRHANLRSADLRFAVLRYAVLSHAVLWNADLSYADLSCANLSEADLRSADFSEADLSEADLSEADFSNTDLRYANLSYANLSNTVLSNTVLWEANLRSAKTDKINWFEYLENLEYSPKDLDKIQENYRVNPNPVIDYSIGLIYLIEEK